MHKEVSIPFSDLRRVSVECGDCHTVIIFDLEGKLDDVMQCPGCLGNFDPDVRGPLRALARLYGELKQARHKFSFRVPEE